MVGAGLADFAGAGLADFTGAGLADFTGPGSAGSSCGEETGAAASVVPACRDKED